MFSCVILYIFRFLVRVSYLEIYNEEVRDLLGKDQQQRLEVSYRISTQSKSPRWLSGEVPTLRVEVRGDWSSVCRVTYKLIHFWQPCQVPGVVGSGLGLVGLVLLYCDLVRWQRLSQCGRKCNCPSRSVHEIYIVCCLDVKQLRQQCPDKLVFDTQPAGTVISRWMSKQTEAFCCYNSKTMLLSSSGAIELQTVGITTAVK